MRTRWHVEARSTDNEPWRTVDNGPRLSTAHRTWARLVEEGTPARLMLNGRPVRMRSDSEQLDLDGEVTEKGDNQ